MTRQGVTQHLAVLEVANLVAVQWRGREKLHFLNPVPLQEIYDRWIRKFERPRIKGSARLETPCGRRHRGTDPLTPDTENAMNAATRSHFVYVIFIRTTPVKPHRAKKASRLGRPRGLLTHARGRALIGDGSSCRYHVRAGRSGAVATSGESADGGRHGHKG